MEPPIIPEYSKPAAPGLSLNFDNSVSLYHIVMPEDSFDTAANSVFDLLTEAQERYPDCPRIFYLEILEHEGSQGGFDDDFFEFQQEFWFSTVAHFVTAFDTPLAGSLVNPKPQKNDLPDELQISESGEDDPSERGDHVEGLDV